jgi:hypothetical protein
MGDHSDAEISTHTTHKKQHPCLRWDRTHDLSRQAAADPRLEPRGHWDRLALSYSVMNNAVGSVVERRR